MSGFDPLRTFAAAASVVVMMRGCALLLLAASGCSPPRVCDAPNAVEQARQAVAKIDTDKSHTAVRTSDAGKSWLVDLYNPDAGVGGHLHVTVAKDSCAALGIQGFQ
jgi:hypothetical protein